MAIYLQEHGWSADLIGTALTLGAIVGVLVTAPAGALVDATSHRRSVVVGASALTVAAACVFWLSRGFWPITLSQIATAVAGSLMGIALTGLTLGVGGRGNFDRLYGRTQVANHAGNMAAAALSGALGWWLGTAWVFALCAAFALACIASVLLIPASAVHRHHARGLAHQDDENPSQARAESIRVLLQSRPLLLLAIVLAGFGLGNSAMLPLYSLAQAAAHHGNASQITAANIIVSQIVMLVTAVYASRIIRRWGFWWVILVTLLTLPLRALAAAAFTTTWGIVPVQILDGVGAGLQGVAIPALVVHLLHGSGRVNLGQGAVRSMEAAGSCLSPLLGGWLASRFGYPTAFVALGSLAIVSLTLWITQGAMIRRACDMRRDELGKMADVEASALVS
ncbi:Major facilitator superfamily MFS_1 [Burkholderia sp. 8Y]|nr:Major facilitator superfamily MFS_1 [Burkholderia sp. 8Y]